MKPVDSFRPIISPAAKVLLLGSMPGEKSLEMQQYYGHPRNHFWPIMADILGFDAQLPYTEKVAHLVNNRVAVWDVLSRCEREGSLDSSIAMPSIEVNDFDWLFSVCPEIRYVFFNGRKAQQVFERHVYDAGRLPDNCALQYLPSTSPANASLSYRQKLDQWRAAFTVL